MITQKIHLKAPDNWVNDPNGFIYYKGYYHIFYQYFPYAPRWGTMHWGHAVSKDLVTWEHRGIALFPTKKEDQNGCFSGSAIEKDGTMHLVYTGVRYEDADPEDIHVCRADHLKSAQLMISSEDGFYFDNWADKRVIIPPLSDSPVGHPADTRDPKIWRGKDAWYLIVGSRTEDRQGQVLFYRSEDLSTWKYVNKAAKSPSFGWMWECPDYFETEGGSVLLLSVMGASLDGPSRSCHGNNHNICFPVKFQEDTCEMTIPDTWQFLDCGLDLYAAQTTVDEAGRRIMTAWLRMPEAAEAGWIGMFCPPRVVEVKDGHVYFRMHPNVQKAYSREITEPSQASPAGYRVCMNLSEGEEADIGGFLIRREDGHIYTDRTAVCPGNKDVLLTACTPKIMEGTQLEILVDENMVEVFINHGEYVVSQAVYHLGKWVRGGSSTVLYSA